MTHIPPITREARDELMRRYRYPQDDDVAFDYYLNSMPLAPADQLDAVRARFGPKTRAGYDYKIFAEWDDHLWGVAGGAAVCWTMEGKCESAGTDPYGLLPASPHSALIEELKIIESGLRAEGEFGVSDVIKRAADALEGDK